jgi:hypothetical protein
MLPGDGTEATAGLLLDRLTTAPPAGAGPLRVTVAVEFLPPNNVVGLRASEASAAGSTISVAVFVILP